MDRSPSPAISTSGRSACSTATRLYSRRARPRASKPGPRFVVLAGTRPGGVGAGGVGREAGRIELELVLELGNVRNSEFEDEFEFESDWEHPGTTRGGRSHDLPPRVVPGWKGPASAVAGGGCGARRRRTPC